MPPRKSRTSVPFNQSHNQKSQASSSRQTTSARKPKKAAKRALDAFAIAAHEVPERTKIRRSRLGELEEGPSSSSSRRKRPRDEDEDGDDDEEEEEQPKRRRRGGDDDSVDEGSDSEGNKWTMGHVDSEDDSDIDSDEAFGESDEERFEGWTFRGSSSAHDGGKRKGTKGKGKRRVEEDDVDMNEDIDLDEGSSADGEEDEEEDGLGEDAIDLATALDQYEESGEDEEEDRKNQKNSSAFDDSEPSEEDDFGADGADDYTSSEDDDEEDDDEDEADKTARLKDLISSLPAEEENAGRSSRRDIHESGAPSEFGVMRKVDLLSFKSKIADPEKRKSLKLLQDDLKPSKRNDIARKLDAPLPKRQQDKLDRAVANEKATEVLSRWVDTVKKNRRAEHLSFPLTNPFESESMGESRLMPTTAAAPANELESTIQSILQQSGLSNGKDDEEQLQKWEELQTNKLPLEEVAKRRAQLRRERELLFREEVRAKRIKKIKSKSYRRVHRKERERLEERERAALKAAGVDVSEDEREYNDRRRAEERMGAKHRESRWAKSVKKTGRAAWDEDARAGVNELARRNEELRRRIEGKEIRDEDEDRSDFTTDEEEDDSDEDAAQVLQKQLKRLKENPFSTDDSKLGNMLFMQKAEAARRQRNDEDVERMRRELAGEESQSEEEDENSAKAGRMKFGPTKAATPAFQPVRGEFEERPGSDVEDEEKAERQAGTIPDERTAPNGLSTRSKKSSAESSQPSLGAHNASSDGTKKIAARIPDPLWKAQDTVSAVQKKSKSKAKAKASASDDDEDLPEAKVSAPDEDGWQTVTYGNNSDNDNDIENEGIDLEIGVSNQLALVEAAFAGDNVEAEFEAEKVAQMDEEAEKEITTHLPGWGAWVGDGLTKNEKKNKGKKSVTKKDGVQISKRKDLKLEKVIINERKIKKNSKFLATQLPFPFETREQYERSLRLPQGKEWTTKKTFQEATKPRVMVKQGIIAPMKKPMA